MNIGFWGCFVWMYESETVTYNFSNPAVEICAVKVPPLLFFLQCAN